MKKFTTSFILLALVLATGLFAEGAKEGQKTFVRMGTAGSGGNYYRLGAGMAALWNDKIPNIQVSIQATKGSPHNADLLADKEIEISFIGGDPAHEAFHNLGTFKDRPKDRYKNMRFVSHAYPNPQHFVAMSWAPEIKTLRDLKGKRVSVGMLGSHGEFLWKETMAILGWTYSDIKAEYTVHQATIDQVRNRQIDAVVWLDGIGSASISEIMDTGFGRTLDIDEDVIKGMTQGMNFSYTVPANTYPKQDKPFKTFASSAVIVAREDVSADLIYNFTKLTYENNAYLVNVHPLAKYMIMENALNGVPKGMPLHPGAERYYREKGIAK
jgi:hypothetical protein